jgi:hypothetical protein
LRSFPRLATIENRKISRNTTEKYEALIKKKSHIMIGNTEEKEISNEELNIMFQMIHRSYYY